MRTLVLAFLVGCAPTAMTTNAQHPANPDAPTGRLAGPPAALRPGVADVSTPVPTSTDYSGHGAAPAASEHAGHGDPGSQPGPAPRGAPAKPEPEPAKPDEPKAGEPAETPRKQHKPPASKKAPAETSSDKPKQPPPPVHQGHEGHH